MDKCTPTRGEYLQQAATHLEAAREAIFQASCLEGTTPHQQRQANEQMLALAAIIETFNPAKGKK